MRHTKYAFTLVEILIVVALLGILAAIVLPTFQDHVQQARESVAKDNLRILRNAIALYAVQHNDIAPGYLNDDPSQPPSYLAFRDQMVGTSRQLSEMPENPLNGERAIKMIGNNEDFPTEPSQTRLYAWFYKPATKTIKLNWAGTDSQGQSYFDY